MKKYKFFILTLLILAISNKYSLILSNISRREKDNNPEKQQRKIITMIDQLEKGIFPLGAFTVKDVFSATLNFLKQDLPFEIKEPLLQRIDSLYYLLPRKDQTKLRKEFRELDKKEYEKRIAEVLTDSTLVWKFYLPFFGEPAFLPEKATLNPALEMAGLHKIPRHLYSQYLP